MPFPFNTLLGNRWLRASLLCCVLSGVVACAAPAPEPSDPARTAPPAGATPSSPQTQPTTPARRAPPLSKPLPPERVREPTPRPLPAPVAGSPAQPDASCQVDTDCAVKNVGNCCGAFPACVNRNSRTDPAAVQAQCAQSGMASICGFKEISGCQCVQGQCQDVSGGPVAR